MAHVAQDGAYPKYNDVDLRGFAGQIVYGQANPPWPQGQFVEYGDQPVGRILYGALGGRVVFMDMGEPGHIRYGAPVP